MTPGLNSEVVMCLEIVRFNFHGDQLDLVRQQDDVYVSVRRACENLGVSHQGQVEKLRNDDSACVKIILTHDASGRNQELFCIHLKSLTLWLATIHPNKVKSEVREKLIAYKRECQDVLYEHFFGKRGASDNAEMMAMVRALAATVEAQGVELATIKAATTIDGCIGGAAAEAHIKRPLRTIAGLQCAAKGLSGRRAMASERGKAESALRALLGWHARAWDKLPRSVMAAATVQVEAAHKSALGAVTEASQARQGTLFGLH